MTLEEPNSSNATLVAVYDPGPAIDDFGAMAAQGTRVRQALALLVLVMWCLVGLYIANSVWNVDHLLPSARSVLDVVLDVLIPYPLLLIASPPWVQVLEAFGSGYLLVWLLTHSYWALYYIQSVHSMEAVGEGAQRRMRQRSVTLLALPFSLIGLGVVLYFAILTITQAASGHLKSPRGAAITQVPSSSLTGIFTLTLTGSLAVSVLIVVAAVLIGAGGGKTRRVFKERQADRRHFQADSPDLGESSSPLPREQFRFVRDTTLNETGTSRTDELDYERFVRTLAATIAESGSASLAIAIEAEWGMGKTTVMRLLQQMLDTDHHCLTVWFDAWKYRPEEIQRAFLSAIVSEIPPPALQQYLQQRRPLARAVLNVIARARNMGDVGSVFADVLDYEMRYRNQLEADFKDIVAYWARGAQRKPVLVIFIDDLDRCSPKGTTQVLEMMKLFANTPGCLFVYGFDPNVVATRIEQEYELPDNDGIEYLRKLIQFEYPLPALSLDRVAEFIDRQVKVAGLSGFFHEVAPKVHAPEGYEQYGYKGLIMRETEWNPRKIKLYLNGIVFAAQMAQPQDYLALYYLMLLRFLEPRLYWLITISVPMNQLSTLLTRLEEYVFAREKSVAPQTGIAYSEQQQDNGHTMT